MVVLLTTLRIKYEYSRGLSHVQESTHSRGFAFLHLREALSPVGPSGIYVSDSNNVAEFLAVSWLQASFPLLWPPILWGLVTGGVIETTAKTETILQPQFAAAIACVSPIIHGSLSSTIDHDHHINMCGSPSPSPFCYQFCRPLCALRVSTISMCTVFQCSIRSICENKMIYDLVLSHLQIILAIVARW